MNITETTTSIRTQLAERRTIRQQRRRMIQELDSFRTPADRAELEAIMSRASDDEIYELEMMIGRPVVRAA